MRNGQALSNRKSFHVREVPVLAIRPDHRNARTHSKRQIRQIAESIREFGIVNPILIDEVDRVIAGHGRLAAARFLQMETVPAIRLSHLNEPQKRALALADNKLAENAGWNDVLLAQELKILSDVEIDFDLTVTGFSQAEIDLRIESLAPADDPEANEIPEPQSSEHLVIQNGDLFRLGPHRLLCGNAMSPTDFEALMSDEKAQMVITDPPYNLPIDGHVSGLGHTKHENFVMAAGEMTTEQFTVFLKHAFTNLAAHSIDSSVHFVFMDWRHLPEVLAAGAAAYTEFKQLCVWVKTNAGMGSFYRSQHELVLVFKCGTATHINNFELGQHGRHRSNVWTYPGVNCLGPDRLNELQMHPTVKPVAMIAEAIKDCSKRHGLVLDPFVGSGTTIIAAEKTGRRAYAMEVDPRHAYTALRRWERYTGQDATHIASGLTLQELLERRLPEGEVHASDPALTSV